MIPAAVYLRVSTEEQTIEAQRPGCMRIVEARGLDVTGRVYEEVQSSAKKRPVFEQLMKDARNGHFQALVFWSLDRLGRSMWETVRDVRELDRFGVTLVSVQETWLETGGFTRDLLISVFCWIAEHERERLRERTKAGMARARAAGSQIGGVRLIPEGTERQAHELRAGGLSWSQIGRQLGISPASARRLCMEYRTVNGLPQTPLSPGVLPTPFDEPRPVAAGYCCHGRELGDDCPRCGGDEEAA